MVSQIMKEAGINLFPAEDSSKYVSIQNKVRNRASPTLMIS